MEPKFESQFKNVFGGKSKEEKLAAHKELRDLLEEGSGYDLSECEVEITERDREIIDFVHSKVDSIVAKFGGHAENFTDERVYFVKEGTILEKTNGELSGGMHRTLRQIVIVERKRTDIEFAVSLAHELFHLRSFKSAQVIDGEVHPYRSGIAVYDRNVENEYFSQLEEAIVAETTLQFYKKEIKNSPIFHDEIESTERLKIWIRKLMERNGVDKSVQNNQLDQIFYITRADKVLEYLEGNDDKDEESKLAHLGGFLDALMEDGGVAFSERYKERTKLYDPLDEVISKSGGRFKNREELFEEFARANFSGKLLPLARIIEDALGKGSFRRIAKEFKEKLK